MRVVLPALIGPMTSTMVPHRFRLGPAPGEQIVVSTASRACSKKACSMVHSFSNQATRAAAGCLSSAGSNRSGPFWQAWSMAHAGCPGAVRLEQWRGE